MVHFHKGSESDHLFTEEMQELNTNNTLGSNRQLYKINNNTVSIALLSDTMIKY